MEKKVLLDGLSERMEKALGVLDHEFKGLRTGRASVNLLDPVQVEAYGSRMPISQVATINTPDARTISVQVWDKTMVKAVEKGIVDANLGLTPATDGQLIRLPLPILSEERRKELAKLAAKYAENTKVAVRNVRRDGMDELKKLEKDHEISKDEHHAIGEDVQKLTDQYIEKIDGILKSKEQEIMSV